jgi:hypothetical protein
MRKHDTPLEKHLSQVAQTQRMAIAPEYDQTHHIGWILKVIERRASALVKAAFAAATAEATVA